MAICRCINAEKTVKINLLRRRQQQIITPHHLSHTHGGIISNNCELICPGTIGAPQYKISAMRCQINALLAINTIGKVDFFIRNK